MNSRSDHSPEVAAQAVRREYARLAARYDSRWSFYVAATVAATVERLRLAPGSRVLDVGCGTGALLAALARSCPDARLAGVDLSPEMLAVAATKLGGAAELREAGAEALPFADAEFDIAVSTSVFHYLRDPHAALAEMKRVLRPAGEAVVTDWCDDFFPCRVCDAFLRTFNRSHFRTYGSAECGRMLTVAGFIGVRIQAYKVDWLWGLMTATGTKPG